MVVKDTILVPLPQCISCELAFNDMNLLISHNQQKHNDKDKSVHPQAPVVNLKVKLTIDKDLLAKKFSKNIYKNIFNKEEPDEDTNNTSKIEEDDNSNMVNKETTKYNMRKRKATNVPPVLPPKKQNKSKPDLKPNSSEDEPNYNGQITKKVRVLLSKNIITSKIGPTEETPKSNLHSQVLSILQDPSIKETVPKSQETLIKETVPKSHDPLMKETVLNSQDPLTKEPVPHSQISKSPYKSPVKSVPESTINNPGNKTPAEVIQKLQFNSKTDNLSPSILVNQIANTAHQDQSEEELEVLLLNPENDAEVMEWQLEDDILPSNDMISQSESDITVLNQSTTIEAGSKDGDGTDSEVIFLSENIFLHPLDCDEENCTDSLCLNSANNEKSNGDANQKVDEGTTKDTNIISINGMNSLTNNPTISCQNIETDVVDRQCEIIELVETSNPSISNINAHSELEIIELDHTSSKESISNGNPELELIELDQPTSNASKINPNAEGEILELEHMSSTPIVVIEEEVIEVVHDSLDKKESKEEKGSSIPVLVSENANNTATSESSGDKNSGSGTDLCDISDLLEGDDEDENSKHNKKYDFNVNDIVWKLSYKTRSKCDKKVNDDDLVNDGNVVAKLFTIREEVKDRDSRKRHFYCIEVPVELPLSSDNIVTRKVEPRLLRPCHSYIENEKILQSQAYRTDIKNLKRQLENVQNYRFNHDDLEDIPAEEKKTPIEYFRMDKYEQSLYLTHLRILKSRMSLQNNGPSYQDVIEKKVIETVTLDDDPSLDNLEEEDSTIRRLTTGLEESWPLSWMSKPEETSKLAKIMRKKIKSERHELFMDPSQHKMEKRKISKLYTIANHSFWEIFGENKEAYDFKIQRELEENVFMKYINEKDTDSRLKELHKKWSWVCGKYVEMVLFPELFISWLQDRTQLKARENIEKLFLSIGGPTQSDRENFEEEVRLEIKKERTNGNDDFDEDEYDDYVDFDD